MMNSILKTVVNYDILNWMYQIVVLQGPIGLDGPKGDPVS